MNVTDLLNNLVSYNLTTDYTAEEEYRRAFQWVKGDDE